MWLQTRVFLLVAVMFGILYGVITSIGAWMGAGSAISYIILAFVFLGIQYLISPSIVGSPTEIRSWGIYLDIFLIRRLSPVTISRCQVSIPRVQIR